VQIGDARCAAFMLYEQMRPPQRPNGENALQKP
jgi:hypothetical protein